MFPTLHSLKCVTRAVLLVTVSASLVATVQPATAQPTSIHPAAAPTLPSNQPVQTSEEVLNRLGIQRPEAADMTELSQQIAQQVQAGGVLPGTRSPQQPEAGGLPENLSPISALSAVIATTLNSSANSNYRDVLLMADADGSEDLVADHGVKVDDLSTSDLPSGWTLTRAAISEHTFANGYTSTVGYYGDSVGNVYVVALPGTNGITTTVLNLPTLLNAFGSLNSDDQIVITGLAVNPVADLSSFANVNGSYSFFDGKIGEILYVSFWDTGGGLNLATNKQLVRSGVLAFPIADDASPARATPAIQSEQDFPVTVGGAFGVVFSVFSNFAGLAVDDDGSVYFQQVDLINFTGGNIVKITSVDQPGTGGNQDRSLATNGIMTLTTLNPTGGVYGITSGASEGIIQVNRFTNYSGTSPTFGNIASLAAAPTNILYAALARSFVPTDTADVQATEGLFANPAELGATPSMLISFADTTGAYDTCTAPLATGTGTLPIPNGIADVAQAGLTLLPGVNNFRAFVLGNGPDARSALVGATVSNTLQMDFQVDYTLFSGLAVDEEAKVYVISGGTPAGIGLNPSPKLGEILVFPDQRLFDRRADYIDLRGDELPNPPFSGGNVGNGVSNRFDHIYYQAPIDQVSLTPVGLSGLARGFLVYLNRTRAWTVGGDLPNGHPQGNDDHSGPLFFFLFDILGQIAGGDSGISKLSSIGADASGPLAPASSPGGFEFIYREYVTTTGTLTPTAWNAFYLNSNGSITFGDGDDTSTPTVAGFLSGLPKVAGAWADLNPGSRWQEAYTNTFPVQALGFAGINHFVVRWINVPSTGSEACDSSNSFTIGLYDDGTGNNESILPVVNLAGQKATGVNPFSTEGPTALRYVTGTNGTLYGFSPRADRSGNLCVTYGRMDLTGVPTTGTQVLVGATPGHQTIPSWPALNLSQAALLNDQPFPWPLGLPMGPLVPATPYELFNLGVPASFTVTGGITVTFPATPTFDLRQEGNHTVLSTPLNQPDLNRGQVCFYISYFRGLFPLVFRQN
ncbi:MAG: hypothetical protein M1546_02725 [Chloroflexi bacterium]|nr:hypothetical protein [Chloroflexota bacterium]